MVGRPETIDTLRFVPIDQPSLGSIGFGREWEETGGDENLERRENERKKRGGSRERFHVRKKREKIWFDMNHVNKRDAVCWNGIFRHSDQRVGFPTCNSV